ncbi:DEAD/DEAH box helicase family protein [Candidatus Pacearchaeota archaeon]|nr:DEAD/DEAH box helicase family protein [Candidatus Pacearchaeota archaeon]
MSGLKDLSDEVKKIYDSDSEDIAYIINLLLEKASKYNRIGSYFTSKSFIALAEGLSEFIKNNGKMRLIINYELEKEDYDEIKKTLDYKKLEDKIFLDINNLKSEIELNSAKVLGWLIAEKRLEIRVVTNELTKLMHIKQGVIEDDFFNKVAFTGSANETYSAYEKNIEQITFFKSWEEGQEEYVDEFLFKFNHFWNDYGFKARTYSLAKAFEKGLIKIRAKSKSELNKAIKSISGNEVKGKKSIIPYSYQKEALASWVNNGNKGIIEMPTGCGKTKTAFFCYKEIDKLGNLITFIFAPTRAICDQWKEEFEEEPCKICKIYDNPKWKSCLRKDIVDLKLKTIDNLVVIGTYALIASTYLINQIESLKNFRKFLIADEVHSTGALKISEGLIEDYDYRLGLSATPKRWLDDEGTNKIFEYFKGVVFDKISLYDAIYKLNVLSEYNYHLIHVILNEEELEKYEALTRVIIQKVAKKEKDKYNKSLDAEIQRLAEKRAKIIKNCKAKIGEFAKLVGKIENSRSLIFVSPEQREEIIELVRKKIRYHQYTFSEKTKIRAETLRNFKQGIIKCIVAIKCLDEGLDVPCADVGIIMSSSGNPREFIQRRGRLLRKDSSKKYAEIYDFFVTPSKKVIDSSEIYKNQISKEMYRINEFSKSARNELPLSKELKEIKHKLGL